MTPYLFLVLLPMVVLIARDAWRDKTPRRLLAPLEWQRALAERAWWTHKRTARERLDAHIRVK